VRVRGEHLAACGPTRGGRSVAAGSLGGGLFVTLGAGRRRSLSLQMSDTRVYEPHKSGGGVVTGPRRSLSLKLSDARVYEPQIPGKSL